ncbi:MAG: bile acid:sodium symporter family protein [Candidatus Glassbacteria bacterium]|nr:bile acid:sodium symporter family protein [Candidatus Glassbacteria bacterium]
MFKIFRFAEKSFAPLALVFSVWAFFTPGPFAALKPYISGLLGLIMFSMGVGLTLDDFRAVAARWRVVLLGAGLQYTVMPLAALALARAFGLGPELAVGMVLVGSCPGGTASNVICYLARADVALSVAMTFFSTLLAPLLTPSLTWLLARQWVPVPFWGLLGSVLLIVVVPLAAGLALRARLPGRAEAARPCLPGLAVIAIVAIIACVVAINRESLARLAPSVALAVVLHNAAGFTLGYWAARLLRLGERVSRTVSIEVGMQNSGLAVSLAVSFFSSAAAVAGALFSLWQNLAGAVLAHWWRSRGA